MARRSRFSQEVRERENRELRRTNDILRKASAYLAQADRAVLRAASDKVFLNKAGD